ncbi:type I restriction enzyme, S subunit [Litoreibacter ascidiaceicola]|uniref:Type I restriction enzyme, S subunit n=1 Tax=Litoreibacter ascidiaceicola TaxID=1486859 RepID=A0A1M4SB78_9RHOB|nr:restriction endonuclease subunit S [Litoreibacter ascidiaceicola]SHE29450.1 type I restriction enzyme, S subunit [Litoreibacter ascidiaceicola]
MTTAQFVQFLDICDIQGGTQPPKSTFIEEPNEGYVRLLQIQDFKTDKKAVYVPDKQTLKKCTADDIMIARYGASLGKILSGLEGAYNVALVKTIPDLERLDRAYFAHFLRADAFQSFILNLGGRAAQAGFNKADLERITIPLPPLEEQKRIAGILDQADTLRRLRTRALDKLNTLGQAIFHEMFGPRAQDWESWPIVPLGELAENLDGKRIPLKKADREKRKGNVPYYGASGIIDFVDEFLFEGTHLLVGEDGANLLARSSPIAFTAEGKFWVNNHAHVLRPNGRSELRFLQYHLESIDLKPFVTGSAQPKLNQKQLNRIPVRLPPKSLQKKFVAALDQRRSIIGTQAGLLSQSEKLFASLQHRAFRGEL